MKCLRRSGCITSTPCMARRTAVTRTGSAADFGMPANAPAASALPMRASSEVPERTRTRHPAVQNLSISGGAVDEGAVGLAAEVEVEQGDARRKGRGCDKGILSAADGVPLGPQAGGTQGQGEGRG